MGQFCSRTNRTVTEEEPNRTESLSMNLDRFRLNRPSLSTLMNIDDDAKEETKENSDHDLAVFTWRLPEKTTEHIKLLCHGYIRIESIVFIPTEIIHICFNYTNDNTYIMQQIKNSSKHTKFDSPIFTFQSMMFTMSLYPNGKDRSNDCVWVLQLISDHSIKLTYSLTLHELKHTISKKKQELKSLRNELQQVVCTNKRLQELESLSITWHINALQSNTGKWFDDQFVDVRTPNNLTINLNECIFNTTPHHFKWKIYDMDSIKTLHDTRIARLFSPLFHFCGFKWHLVLSPHHNNDYFALHLSLSSFAPHLQKVIVQYRIFLEGTDLEHAEVTSLDASEPCTKDWNVSKSKTDLNHLMFTVYIQIIHVYERYESVVTKDYLADHYTEDVSIASYDSDTFTWTIPSIHASQVEITVHGYWRRHTRVYLDPDVMRLCAAYLRRNALSNTSRYRPGESIHSQPFIIGGLRWMMKIYPTGTANGSLHRAFCICLYLMSMPAKIDRVTLFYQVEAHGAVESDVLYLDNSDSCKRNVLLSTLPSQTYRPLGDMTDVSHLSVVLTLNIIDRFDDGAEGHVIGNKQVVPSLPLYYDGHQWTVSDTQTMDQIKSATIGSGQHFCSPIFVLFGLKWFIDVYPDGIQQLDRFSARNRYTKDKGNFRFFLHLVSMPSNVRRIFFEYELEIKEIDFIFHHITNFSSFKKDMTDGWPSGVLKKSDIQQHTQFTFVVRMRLIHIFGFTGNELTKTFVQPAQLHTFDPPIAHDTYSKSHTWHVETKTLDQKNTQRNVFSPLFEMYGMRWCMEFMVNRNNKISIRLWLTNLSTKLSKIVVKYRLSSSITTVQHVQFAGFTTRSVSALWSFNEIINYSYKLCTDNPLTCTLDMELVEVCGSDSKINPYITDKYRNAPSQDIKPYHMNSYTWKVPDELMQKIAHIDGGHAFTSPIFIIQGLKWIIELYPNGRYLSGSLKIYLQCVSMLPEISRAVVIYKVSVPELSTVYSSIKMLSKYSYARSCDGMPPYQNYDERVRHDKLVAMKALSIEVDMAVLNVFNQKGKSWMDYIWFETPCNGPCDSFSWSITDKKTINDIKCCTSNRCFISPIFELLGLKWCFQFYPNGDNEHNLKERKLYLKEASWPVNISSMYFAYAMCLKEANISWSDMASFEYYRLNACWDDKALRNMDITLLHSLTFTVDIRLVDVYDTDNMNITSLLVQNAIKSRVCTPELSDFAWRVDPVQLMNDVKQKASVCWFSSPFQMHSFRWYLQLVVDKHHKLSLHLWLTSLSPNIDNVVIKYRFSCTEMDKEQDWKIDKFHGSYLSHSWSIGNVHDMKNTIAVLEQLTFTAQIALIDIYDHKTRLSVTDQYINVEMKEPEVTTNTDSYCWEIASVSKHDTLCLCTGYIRKHLTQFMEDKIVILCGEYLHYDTLTAIKEAKLDDCFTSDVFILHGLKWAFELYPIGKDDDLTNHMDVSLSLVSSTPNIPDIFALCELTINEINFACSTIENWKGSHSQSLIEEELIPDEPFQNISKSLTIAIKMTILDTFDKDGFKAHNISIPKPVMWRKATDVYSWNINDTDTMKRIHKQREGEMFCSSLFNMHGFKWYLEFYPNGHMDYRLSYVKCILRLVGFPPRVSKVFVYCRSFLKETDTKFSSFNCLHSSGCTVRWPRDTLETEAIATLDTLSFCVEITLIDVYHNDGHVVTEKYLNDGNVRAISRPLSYKQGTKTWKVSDMATLDEIQSLRNGESLECDVFEIGDLQFKIKFFPNGHGEDSEDYVNCFFYLISLAPMIDTICIKYTLCLTESDTFHSDCVALSRSNKTFAGWENKKLHSYAIKNRIDSLTIQLDMTILDIFTNDECDESLIQSVSIPAQTETETDFVWIVSDDKILNEMKTAPCGWDYSTTFLMNQVKYEVQLYPNGFYTSERGKVQFRVKIDTLPRNIGGISLWFSLVFKETNVTFSNYLHFNKDDLSLVIKENSALKKLFISYLKQYTMSIHIKLIAIYDIKGNLLQSN
eukprot:324324_1